MPSFRLPLRRPLCPPLHESIVSSSTASAASRRSPGIPPRRQPHSRRRRRRQDDDSRRHRASLQPDEFHQPSDSDYYARDIAAEFAIEAIVSLPPATGISEQAKPSWPWEWNGTDAVGARADAQQGTTSPSIGCVCAARRISTLAMKSSSLTAHPTPFLSAAPRHRPCALERR